MNENPNPVALIKQSLVLSTLVARYAAVSKRGTRHVACCPFHAEKTPSFYIDDRKGLFHCFGCGKGGDLIHFVQEIEQMDFPEALSFLAELAGVELPERTGRRGPGRKKLDALRAINDRAATYFQSRLKSDPAAMRYLRDRGVDPSIGELFRIGYATEAWDGLCDTLKADFDSELLLQSGLVRQAESGRMYDFFRHRIIFPITDAYGHVVAFGGRRMADEGPKYINSSETPLYVKGKHVYSLQFAKPYLRKDPTVVVVEGYLDAIQVYQAGIGTVVASLGTAFTPDQARLLKRYAQNVILNFDGDAAGFKATRASIETLLQGQMSIKVVALPHGQDPDDYIRAHGADAYREALDRGTDFYAFMIEHMAGDLSDPHEKSLLVQELCQTIGKIPDPVVREHYLQRLADDLDVGESVVRAVLKGQSEPAPKKTTRISRPKRSGLTQTEKELLCLAMKNKNLFEALSDRDKIMNILQILFSDRLWVIEFIEATQIESGEDPFRHVPDQCSVELRSLLFTDEFSGEAERLSEIIPDLVRAMISKRRKANDAALRELGPAETEKKRAFLKQNFELDRHLHQLDA